MPAELPVIDPARKWYAEPARVFDDLFFLGQTAFSVWGLRTKDGIILVDSIFDYSVEAEVIEGLRKLGIDPAEIRYVIISHAHVDHSGGAGILQQHGARVVMSEADWQLYEKGNDKIKAKRDIVATDGMPITLGGATVRVYLTPGHTHGTISTVLPVHDNGKPHVAALWGGTLFNFRDSPDDPRDARLKVYAESAAKFRAVTRAAGADILLSNHTAYDGTTVKLPGLAGRKAGQPQSVCHRRRRRAALFPGGRGMRHCGAHGCCQRASRRLSDFLSLQSGDATRRRRTYRRESRLQY